MIGVDPKLSPLGDYGGPTPTMTPLPGSPAIGGTAIGATKIDQRGQPRTGRVDIGAFETQPVITDNAALDGLGSGPGQISLRQAVNLANALPTADAITFAAQFANSLTITLTAGPLVLTDKATTTIAGPGANLLTVSGNEASRVFDVAGGSAAISGLTVTGGSADSGAGLRNSGGTLVIKNVTVSGNTATGLGGGVDTASGATTLTNCTVSGNAAKNG